MNPNSIKKCIKCGAKLEKDSGGAALKPAASTDGPMLKAKEKPAKQERMQMPMNAGGEPKKSSKFILILLIVIIAAALLYFFKDKLLTTLGQNDYKADSIRIADSIWTADSIRVADSLKIADSLRIVDSLRQAAIQDSIVLLYKGKKRTAQDTTVYKTLSDAEKAQLGKKKKSYNEKFYYAKDNKKMILIKGHTFTMGTNKGTSANLKASPETSLDLENPAHSVRVKDFYLDETEVTNGQFKKFLEETKYKPIGSLSHFRDRRFNHDDMPVVDVDYYDAVEYAKWAGKRLPFEREWECAAKDSHDYEYPTGNDMTESQARFGMNIKEGFPRTVKSYRPNHFGIYDLAGNVSEWVHGVISQYPGNKTPSKYYGSARVPRGGSWMSPKEDCKTYRRAILDISKSMGNIGFRCAIGRDEVIELQNK